MTDIAKSGRVDRAVPWKENRVPFASSTGWRRMRCCTSEVRETEGYTWSTLRNC